MTAIVIKETLKETNRLKSKCSVNSSIYILLKGHGLLLLIRKGHMTIASNLYTKQHRNNTETSHANMRYAKSLTLSPTVASKLKLYKLREYLAKDPDHDYESLRIQGAMEACFTINLALQVISSLTMEYYQCI